MRKTTPTRIGDLWNDFLKERPDVARRIGEARAVEAWGEVVGPMVAYFTTSVSVERGVLTAKISSAAARSEIFMRRAELKEALNSKVGTNVIRTVIIK